MSKTWKYLLMAALILGLGMNVTSCKDDNDDENNERTPEEIAQDPYEKESEAADALYRLVSQLSVCDSLPNNWKTATFEPKAGKVLDASQPRVRTIAVNNAAEAVARYNSLTGKDLPATTITDTYKVEGVGTLTLNVGGAGTIATIDVDVKQMPQLAQLRFVSVADMGENGHFRGEPYYRFGDVVRDKKGCYWICVRPAYSPDGKEDTHWMSFQVIDKNIKTYTKKGCEPQVYPVDLGVQMEKMQYLAQLMAILANPEGYKATAREGNFFFDAAHNYTGLGGLEEEAMPVDSLERQAALWNQNKIWEKVMPVGFEPNEVQTFKDRFKHGQLCFIYEKGSVMDKDKDKLLTIKYTRYIRPDLFFRGDYQVVEKNIDMQKYDFDITKNYTTKGTSISPNVFPPDAFVVRYKTGYQLSSNWLFNPSATDSIPGVTTVHRFNACKNTQLIKSYTKEQAQPRMIMAKNGLFYKSEADCKTDGTAPVALVVYVGDSVETNSEYRRLAMSYTIISNVQWDKDAAKNDVCIEKTSDDKSVWEHQNDGVVRTRLLATDGHDHPAAKAARDFKVADFNRAAYNFSPWFLPTAGQLMKAIKGLGGQANYNQFEGDWTCKISEGLSTELKNAGITTFDVNFNCWTSTEVDQENAVLSITIDGDILIDSAGKDQQSNVCPFIAF